MEVIDKFIANLLEKCCPLSPFSGMPYEDIDYILRQVKRRLPDERARARKQGVQKPTSYIEEMLVLHISVWKGDEKFVRRLLYYGADPNSRDSEGTVALWEAMVGRHEKVIKALLAYGANLFSGDMGRFACTAVEKNDLGLLKEMVLYGADIALPNKRGETALQAAGRLKNKEIVQFLLDEGADRLHGRNADEYIVQKRREREEFLRKRFPHLYDRGTNSHEGTVAGTQGCGQQSARVTISCLHSSNAPKLVGLPQSLEELLELSTSKFGILSTKVLTADRAEIDDISLIRDGDHLILASDSYRSQSNNQNDVGN